jgi:hypothetical protein
VTPHDAKIFYGGPDGALDRLTLLLWVRLGGVASSNVSTAPPPGADTGMVPQRSPVWPCVAVASGTSSYPLLVFKVRT